MKKPAHKYRHELKFLISRGTYEILRQRLIAVMKPDPHAKNGKYRVTSLYFDDVFGSALHDKRTGTLSRKKFRIRTYDLDPSYIRLEEKCKDGDVGYKKSAVLTLDEYRRILSRDTAFLAEERFSSTAGEDFLWAYSSMGLAPAAAVDYVREPYICEAGNVRVTFDMKLRAGNMADMFDKNARYIPVLPANEAVLEVKYDNFLPRVTEEILSGLPIMREAVSKFVICGEKISLNERTW